MYIEYTCRFIRLMLITGGDCLFSIHASLEDIQYRYYKKCRREIDHFLLEVVGSIFQNILQDLKERLKFPTFNLDNTSTEFDLKI